MTELTYSQVNRDLIKTMAPPKKNYYLALAGILAIVGVGLAAEIYQLQVGLGVSGLMHPVAWAVYITNFVFWVGIAHSGTLISAILFLLRCRWRTSVYRTAEAMTVFALMTAGLFPLIHLGRPWFFYWLLPYPDRGILWPNFRSPLMWDVFAVSTYLTVSVMFFITGLVPDVAAVRDKATGLRKKIYGLLALGWQGTDNQWRHYSSAYLFLAALATPLVISVHSVVSWDFAMSIVPGWHSTIFAPYFVAGAIHSGLAMVLTIMVPLRKTMKLEDYITGKHLESLAKLIILTGLIVGYSYIVEFFIAWYSQVPYEQAAFHYRAFGSYKVLFWLMVLFNTIVPLFFFSKKFRTSTFWLLAIAIMVNIGMWLERFVIIAGALSQEYDPFAWGLYKFRLPEILITLGSFGWFFLLFLIFIKILPVVSITEIKEEVRHETKEVNL